MSTPSLRNPKCFSLQRGMLIILILFSVFPLSYSSARSVKLHGPIIQWHEDPTTTASFSWIEQLMPETLQNRSWKVGNAGFGYGDSDDFTVLGGMRKAYQRVYIAKQFPVKSVPKGGDLRLAIKYDDAFILFINGREVARSSNIKGFNAYADVTEDHEADNEEVVLIKGGAAFLKKGQNLISVEGHNVKLSSSDFTLDLELSVGAASLVSYGEAWTYLAGSDPSIRWFLKMPKNGTTPELAKTEETEWEFYIRRKGTQEGFRRIPNRREDFGESGALVFKAKVEGLRPNTAYEYKLNAGRRQAKVGWFRTAPQTLTKPMRFIVGGDMGTSTAVPVSRAVGEEDPLFVVVGGDLAYANGRAYPLWYEWMDNWTELIVAPDGRSIPIVAVIGNHEMKSFSGLRKREIWKGFTSLRPKKSKSPYYFSLFDLPGGNSNFAVDFGKYLSFIVLDSGHAQKESSQTQWLEKSLKERTDFLNLYTVYHKPAWGAGIKKNDKDVQEEWVPLFEKYQIDASFENDHHGYKRSHPLTNGRRDESKGILYLGDGAWGATLRPITDKMLDREGARDYLAKWGSIHHVSRVTIYPNGKRKYEAIDSDRKVFDSVTDAKARR